MRRSNSRSVQSSDSESTISWNVSASGIARRKLPEDRAVEQEDVERDDQRGYDRRQRGRRATVDQVAHDVAPAGQQDERHERERDAEAQNDLRQHERAGGLK